MIRRYTGLGNDELSRPMGLRVYNTLDRMYVADSGNHRLMARNLAGGGLVAQYGTYGTGNDNLSSPRGISLDSALGYLYVADAGNHRIVVRSLTDLSYVGQYGTYGTGNDNLSSPEGVLAISPYLYVVDTGNNRIVKRLLSDLSYVSKVGSLGSGNDQFDAPIDCKGISGQYMLISDSANNRIVKRLLSDLSYVSQFGSYGVGDSNFNHPSGLSLSATDGIVWVCDTYNMCIKWFALDDFSFVGKLSVPGVSGLGITRPYAVARLLDGLLIVEAGESRILRLQGWQDAVEYDIGAVFGETGDRDEVLRIDDILEVLLSDSVLMSLSPFDYL